MIFPVPPSISDGRRRRALGRLLAAAAAAFLWGPLSLEAQSTVPLYSTGFEDFPVGADQLVGFDGWQGDNSGEAVHGIDQDMVPGLGKSAFLGFGTPSDSFVRVFRPVDYDPVREGTPEIEFFALMGIQESTVGGDDYFFVTVINSSRQALAAIRFRVTFAGIQTSRFDGVTMHAGLGGHVPNEVFPLLIRIDFAANRWSVTWGDVPLVDDAQFTARSVTRDLGAVAAEWQVATAGNPGNNWMLFDEWAIEAVVPAPFAITSSSFNPDGSFTFSWDGEAGASYTVQHSPDMVTWSTAETVAPASDGPLSFTDSSGPATSSRRFYRVARTFISAGSSP